MRIGLMALLLLAACTPPIDRPQAYSGLQQSDAYCLQQFGVACPPWFLRAQRGEVAALPRNADGPGQPTIDVLEETPGRLEVRLVRDAGVLKVPARINGAITLDFILDSGAADVSIPADVFLTLSRTGTIEKRDLLGKQSYRLADGRAVSSQLFQIRSLSVGGHTLSNVLGSVAPASASLLLGQSFLSRFSSWSIDNSRHVLVLN